MPAKTPYKYGYLVELRAKEKLEQLGAKIVIRSSRSLTPADLVALFPDRREIWLIQVKKMEVKDTSKLKEKFSELATLSGTYTVVPCLFAKNRGRYEFIKLTL
uniref:Holliday junction resolvase n=1 Tax=Ignisphaera aggregans TaxID=334771 RepID=A0A7J3JQU3_9CREN